MKLSKILLEDDERPNAMVEVMRDYLEGKISEEQKSDITSILDKLKDAHSKKDVELCKSLVDEVNLSFQKISQDLYEQVNNQTGETEFTGSDVEFEEVKP